MDTDTSVAFYVPSLTGGGAQRVTVNLANGFVDRGVHVDLVVSYHTGELINEISDSVSIVDLETPQVPLIGVAASIPAISQYLKRETPDVLFSQMHYANVISVVAHRLSTTRTALVLTEHTIFGQASQPKDTLMFSLARRSHPLADHVIAVSSGVAESVRDSIEIPDSKVSVINNPIVTPSLRGRTEAAIDHPWLDDPDVEVVLGVGRVAPEKDFSTLVRAIALAQETNPSLRLVILGEGPRREALQRVAENLEIDDLISLPGYVDNPYAYMRRADVFALSSRREGLPTALVEAMACGCPVVATDCRSGPREILDDGRYGPLVPVGDSEALASEIERTLRDPVSSDVLKQRAEDFSTETVLDEYERLVNRLA